MIITSNRAFEEWAEVFGNDLLASAALDRLTHHAYTLVIRGDSYRQRGRRRRCLLLWLTNPLQPNVSTRHT